MMCHSFLVGDSHHHRRPPPPKKKHLYHGRRQYDRLPYLSTLGLWVMIALIPFLVPSVTAWSAIGCYNSISNPSRRAFCARVVGASLGTIATPMPSQAKNLPTVYAKDLAKTGTVETLRPIVKMEKELQRWLLLDPMPTLEMCSPGTIIEIPTTESEFKALFDAYSTPLSYQQKYMDANAFLVYYTQGFDGPNRPSIETANQEGSTRQTNQYGYRNDAWTAWESFLVECDYNARYPPSRSLRKGENNPDIDSNPSTSVNNGALEDIQNLLQECLVAVQAYLAEAPSADVEQARQ